jgi:hypothetical protein
MANKIQIKRFLETKQQEVLAKLNEESVKLQEQAEDNFFKDFKEKFQNIKSEVASVGAEYDKLAKKLTDSGLATFGDRYNSPHYCFNELISKCSIGNLKKYYIDVIESEKIKTTYEKKIEETKREYDNLIALCSANSAIDGIKILENLGFDTSEIEVKKESTALITNIDASKLFI